MRADVATPIHRAADALLGRLRLAFPRPPFDVQVMSPAPSKAEWERATRIRPFIGFAWAGFDADAQARHLNGKTHFIIYLVVDNVGSVEARYRGDGLGIGLWGMIVAAATVLHGVTIEGVGSSAVTGIDSVHRDDWADDATAIAAIGVDVTMSPVTPNPAGANLPDLLRLTCAWEIPAPDGSAPMPTDTITLRG